MPHQYIVPNIWCQGNAEEVGRFYSEVLPDTTSEVAARYPETGLLDFQQDFAGLPLMVTVTVRDFRLSLINAGQEFAPNPAISFFLMFGPVGFGGPEGAREALDRVWAGLADGGEVLMPLQQYPFSERYGWVQDRFGVSWQLGLFDEDGADPPFVMPALLFGGPAQNRAVEARAKYAAVFGDDFEAGDAFPYGEQTGPATPDALMYSEFRIKGVPFTAMDSGVEQDFSFTSGVSLEVHCADQAEIDRLWEGLSAAPEAEQCGWLADEFGVSWQIVPANMGELMEHPGAFERMLQMKKIVIDEL
ncbi:VOC family protein [Leucobacter sp. USHLN153]|uniref:VOC family protein n=1 Tax=Leucobacter sp. USHLN153 TaxID=3081268 RepID=UPI003019923F